MRKKEKQFFFEKKNQKTFATLAYAAGGGRDSDPKVFCFFFSKKKTFPCLLSRQRDFDPPARDARDFLRPFGLHCDGGGGDTVFFQHIRDLLGAQLR
jgi:hypothetical protein